MSYISINSLYFLCCFVIFITNVNNVKIRIREAQKFQTDWFYMKHGYSKSCYSKHFRNNKNLQLNIKKFVHHQNDEIKYNERYFYSLININNLKLNLKNLMQKYCFFFNTNEENNIVHPLKNCRWKITVYNFLLKNKNSFYIYIYENGKIKTSENLEGIWFYNNYHITWCIEYEDKKVYYTAELLWNNDKSRMIKGIIYKESKNKNSFLPSYFFRKILGSFDGQIQS
ncbi:hypothetical protein MKS88_004266 [Plasmodium brasilianum]|uniref:Uncharacterized protein n=3 Tax=Plasmodium (Plasmodium) TaxID=418103 RepID=A0A1D3SPA4_PLAMA|nr:conserved Plasmodium protein, unknown function [Plasmodium malariae]KAI4836469.1 hypothetical protein MKS88_004266 [Plasmodium brasilianum]SCO93747.1 conserved Plasmodium protein, unknown function [Plasmodium malariae]